MRLFVLVALFVFGCACACVYISICFIVSESRSVLFVLVS